MIGLELHDTHACAVRLDEAGHVLARAQLPNGGDLGAAAVAVLEQVHDTAASPARLGVAAINPESPTIAPVVAQLGVRFDGPFRRDGALLSGTAAAAAEAWVGAARGVKDVVYFAVGQHATGGVVRDGVAIAGARRRAGSVAWLSLNPVEREDYRKAGCLEAEVAAASIVRRLI